MMDGRWVLEGPVCQLMGIEMRHGYHGLMIRSLYDPVKCLTGRLVVPPCPGICDLHDMTCSSPAEISDGFEKLPGWHADHVGMHDLHTSPNGARPQLTLRDGCS